jgi:mannosyltransferase
LIAVTLSGRPAYRPKFTFIASPAFCLLVGQGIALLEGTPGQKRTTANRLWLLLGMGIVAVGAARSLRNYYGDPAYARSDYRAMAASITALGREGDAILLNAPNQWEVFTYYYRGRAPVYPLCRSRPPDEASVVAELEGIAAQHERLFALYWATDESDPQRIVERWLQEHTFKASDAWYGDVRLVTYAVPVSTEAAEMAHPLEDVRLGASIALRGYTLTPSEVQVGDILQVTLFWEALEVPATRYKVFVHLVDDRQQIVAQYDGEPGDGMNLTTNWTPEQGTFPDRYGIWVPYALASGKYGLLVGMYDVSGAPRLPIAVNGQPAGDALLLETVEIR